MIAYFSHTSMQRRTISNSAPLYGVSRCLLFRWHYMIYRNLGEVFTLRFMTRTSGIRPFWIWRKSSGLSIIESGAGSCHTMHCNQHSTGIRFQLWHHIILIVKSNQFNFIAVILWSPTCISPTGPLRAIKALHLGHSSFFVSPID